MKSVVAASFMAGAFALDSKPICNGDNDQIKPQPGCFSAPYGSGSYPGTVSVELEEVNGDSGVITFKGDGGYGLFGLIWDCESIAYTRKGTKILDLGVFSGFDTNRCDQPLLLDTAEVEFCPNQDAFRFTEKGDYGVFSSRSTFMPRVACPTAVDAIALDSRPICDGDNDQIKPQPGCFSAPYGSKSYSGSVSVELEEVNGDSGVITFKGDGGYGLFGLIWDCESIAYTRKGTKILDLGVFSGFDTNRCDQPLLLDTAEVEFCPNQDAFRFTEKGDYGVFSSRSTFMPRVACPTAVDAIV